MLKDDKFLPDHLWRSKCDLMSLTNNLDGHWTVTFFLSFISRHNVMFQCHAAIRKDPSPKAKSAAKVTKKRWNAAKIGLAARKAKVEKTKAEFLAQIEEQKE